MNLERVGQRSRKDLPNDMNRDPVDAVIFDILTLTAGKGPRSQIIKAALGLESILRSHEVPAYCIETKTNTNGYHEYLPTPIVQVDLTQKDIPETFAAVEGGYIDAIGTILREKGKVVDGKIVLTVGVASVGYEAFSSFGVNRAIEYWNTQEIDGLPIQVRAVVVNFDSTFHSGQEPLTETDPAGYPLDSCSPEAYTGQHIQTWQLAVNSFAPTAEILSDAAGEDTIIAGVSHPFHRALQEELISHRDISKSDARKVLADVYQSGGMCQDYIDLMLSEETVVINLMANQEYFTGIQGTGRKFLTDEQHQDVQIKSEKVVQGLLLVAQRLNGSRNDKQKPILVFAAPGFVEIAERIKAENLGYGGLLAHLVDQDEQYRDLSPTEKNAVIAEIRQSINETVTFIPQPGVLPDQMKYVYRASDALLMRTTQMNSMPEAVLMGKSPLIVNMPGHNFMHSDRADEYFGEQGGISFDQDLRPEGIAFALLCLLNNPRHIVEKRISPKYEDLFRQADESESTNFFAVMAYAFGISMV